jgi:uncharacterized protein YeaO (DUF488 family)
MLKIKRVYDKSSPDDGQRLYVDRLWPRGLRREQAAIDEWLKDISPGDELRRWFGHRSDRFAEFRRRYSEELAAAGKRAALDRIARMARETDVTLLYSARDTEHNNAVVLAELISRLMKEESQD